MAKLTALQEGCRFLNKLVQYLEEDPDGISDNCDMAEDLNTLVGWLEYATKEAEESRDKGVALAEVANRLERELAELRGR